ncbi:MAG: DUF262 domain-containing protein [Magnetococcus sp. DMHC-1]
MTFDNKIVEEHEENQPTGVESEDQDSSDRDISRPYDPRKIRVDSKPYSIAQVIELIGDGDLDIAPDFQRRRVWKNDQKSLLIESILLRIPLPVFYFAADEDGRMQVVDGVQRLSTIQGFMHNEFSLSKLEYLQKDLLDKKYENIVNTIWSRRFLQTAIIVYVIDPQTPDDVKFDIFRRLNTGGTPLNSQEIRHCISKKRTRDFLGKLSGMDEFHKVVGDKIKNHVRMVDLELALRYCAFKLLGDLDKYSEMDGMDDFLTKTVRKLDDPIVVSDKQLDSLEAGFKCAMDNAWVLFREHSFRKWRRNEDRIYPVNRSLFDVWSVSLSEMSIEFISIHREKIVKKFQKLIGDDKFLDAITSGTSKPAMVKFRFNAIKDLLGSAMK